MSLPATVPDTTVQNLLSSPSFTIYYGVDWLAMLLTLIAIYLIGNKAKSGFVLMIIGNLCWIGLGFLSGSIAMILANIVFAGMNMRAIIKWSEDESNEVIS